jgi:hypothetical protein
MGFIRKEEHSDKRLEIANYDVQMPESTGFLPKNNEGER